MEMYRLTICVVFVVLSLTTVNAIRCYFGNHEKKETMDCQSLMPTCINTSTTTGGKTIESFTCHLQHDDECSTLGSVKTCYCNQDLCNGEARLAVKVNSYSQLVALVVVVWLLVGHQ